MKNKLKELEVDIIGRQDKQLTIEEQAAITAFLKERREQRRKKAAQPKTTKDSKHPKKQVNQTVI